MRVQLVDNGNAANNRRYAYTNGGQLLGEYTGAGYSWYWKRDVLYLGSRAVAEIDGNGLHELHSDPLGTPRSITNSNGAQEGVQAFGPYGESLLSPYTSGYAPLTGYTGHIRQDPGTGLIYMRGRYYSPGWHRFLNSDQGVDPNLLNQFGYVGGRPFGATDPSGMTAYSIDGIPVSRDIFGAVIGGSSGGVGGWYRSWVPPTSGSISAIWSNLNGTSSRTLMDSDFSDPGYWQYFYCQVSETTASSIQNGLGVAGWGMTGLQYGTPGMTVAYTGSNVGRMYLRFNGNQYVSVARVSSIAQNAGYVLSAASAGTTLIQVANGEVIPEKGAVDLAATGLAAFAGPGGLIISGSKTFVESNWRNDGGWGQMFRDAGNWYGNNWAGNALTTTGNFYSNYR